MVLLTALYIAFVWLLVSRLKLVRWGWLSGTVIVLGGVLILSVFLGLLNTLTPSGRFVVASRVVEVTSNVSGQVVEIPVQPNVLVKKGSLLFRLEDAPFRAKVEQLEAALAQSRQGVKQLQASHMQAKANVESINRQLDYHAQRLSDLQKLASTGSQAEFRVQDAQVQYEVASYQLQSAQAAELSARLALDSMIGGENTSVAQIEAQLESAKWDLEQTRILAPADGYVSTLALVPGARALQARSVMSFIVADDIGLIGFFQPNGFRTVKPGATALLVFENQPGRIFRTTVLEVPKGVGQGQIAVSGQLARVGSIGGAQAYPALLNVPAGYSTEDLRVGLPGAVWVISERAGPIGLIAAVLAWIGAYVAYL